MRIFNILLLGNTFPVDEMEKICFVFDSDVSPAFKCKSIALWIIFAEFCGLVGKLPPILLRILKSAGRYSADKPSPLLEPHLMHNIC